MLAGIAALDDAVVPVVVERLGDDSGGRGVGIGAEIADPRVNVQDAVRRNPHQAVEAPGACRVIGLADADADHLRAVPFAAALDLLRPAELLGADFERFALVGAGHLVLVAVEDRTVVRRVDLADFHPVDAEVLRGPIQEGFEGAGDLVLSRTALRPAWRRIGEDRDAPVLHRIGLVADRHGGARLGEVPETRVRAVGLDDVHVDGVDLAVFRETDPRAPLEPGPVGAQVVFFGARDPQHYRAADLLREMRRQRHRRIRGALGAEAAAAVLGDVDQVFRLDADQPGQARDDEALALRRAVDEAFAVLPVGQAGARFHRVVRVARRHEGLVVNHGRPGEFFFQITVGPFRGRRAAHRQLVFLDLGEVPGGPLDGLQRHRGIGDVAAVARVRPARIQAVQRVDHEVQRLVFDADFFQGVGRGPFVDGRDSEYGLADEMRVVGEDHLARTLAGRHVLGRQDPDDAFHRLGFAGIDADHPSVRHRRQQHFCEDHALGAEILGVFCLARYLAADVRRREILS